MAAKTAAVEGNAADGIEEEQEIVEIHAVEKMLVAQEYLQSVEEQTRFSALGQAHVLLGLAVSFLLNRPKASISALGLVYLHTF